MRSRPAPCARRAVSPRYGAPRRCSPELRTETSGGACRSCSAYSSCQGGCMAAKFFTGLPLDGPDPECVKGHGASALPALGRRRAAASRRRTTPTAAGPCRWACRRCASRRSPATPVRWRSWREHHPDRAHRPRAAPRALPGDVRAARDQPRPAPGDLGSACRLLRAAGGGGQRRHRDRDGQRAPVGLALRARTAGCGLRAGLGPDRRGLPAARGAGAGRARSRRDAGLLGVLPVRAVGTVAGTGRGISRAAHGDGGAEIDALVDGFAAAAALAADPGWTVSRSTPASTRCCASSSPG